MDEFDADRASAERLDRDDPLAWCAERFTVPAEIYLDGNSLGPLSADAERALDDAIDEWRELGVRGWTDADPPWFRYGERLGDRLAPLVGARESEVVVANATTVNIHTLIGTFLDGLDDGSKILVNELDFPTDHYAIRAQFRQRGLDPDDHLVAVESVDGRTIDEERVVAAMDDHDVDILFMPSVLYRSGQLLDIEYLTRAAHERDVLAGFDLAHSIGVVSHDLSEWEVDFAVWCSYKYLNAGPGAIAGLYVNQNHFGTMPALAGWWGHEKATQFDMNPTFTPAADAGAYQIGTIPIFSAAPLDGALDLIDEVGIDAIREKSLDLTSYLVALVDDRLGNEIDGADGCTIGTPRDPGRRGGHVAIEHPDAERIAQALTESGVVVDFRPPNVVRMCPSPLYTSYADVWDAVERWRKILDTAAHERFDADRSGVS
ncbi:kynureninase [Halococcus saccharolyticus]|uniref:Kynureninase n=1 Tax=Halococcus saccharolyticus DSM 5350 TaxID=1227455 RepID=M0MEB5_9EURY|nr:kynureninase [Halococcus saccharolyticus]EMA44071.1 kynureninase [Halococcus saccharolyticus DSM 5350]